MRNRSDLKFIVDRAIATCGGTCPMTIEAEDEAEVAEFKALLKGRRGASPLDVQTAAQIKATAAKLKGD